MPNKSKLNRLLQNWCGYFKKWRALLTLLVVEIIFIFLVSILGCDYARIFATLRCNSDLVYFGFLALTAVILTTVAMRQRGAVVSCGSSATGGFMSWFWYGLIESSWMRH